MNRISQTIMESLELNKLKFLDLWEGYVGYDFDVCEILLEKFESHLLQSQIKLIEVVIEEMKERNKFNLQELTEAQNDAYNKALEDQISSLNETLEFLKKSL